MCRWGDTVFLGVDWGKRRRNDCWPQVAGEVPGSALNPAENYVGVEAEPMGMRFDLSRGQPSQLRRALS